jgi:hypothetical protein
VQQTAEWLQWAAVTSFNDGDRAIDEESTAEALEALGDLAEWQLPAERWDRVAAIIEVLIHTYTDRDGPAFRNAIIDLEMAGPVRITRIGATPTVPPPQRVRDRANHLVHSLAQLSRDAIDPNANERIDRRGSAGDTGEPV